MAAVQPILRLATHWRQPLYRTGHLLVANSVLTAAVGVGYWLLAARLYPPATVGVNSAAISAMLLVAGVAQLNLMSALLRFLPGAGAEAGRMIRRAYAAGGALSALAAAGFLLGLPLWAPDLTGLLRPAATAVAFVAGTACWSLFVMQDNALVAVGRPVAVPVENLAFAVLKVALVVAFCVPLAGAGIWWSWTVATAVTVAGTTGYLFRYGLPGFAAAHPGAGSVPSRRELGRFIAPDYLGSLAWIAATTATPLLVLYLTDPARSAVFALAWSICLSLYHVPAAFGQSLVAHGVTEQARLDRHHRDALRHTLGLLAPVVVLVVLLAPAGMGLFGAWYAAQGTTALRLLALSALPNAVVALAVSRARAAGRMTTVVVLLVGLSGLVLGLSLLLVPHVGITGGGVAWLGGQLVVGTAALVHGFAPGGRVRTRRAGIPGSTLRAALERVGARGGRTLTTVSGTATILVRPEGTAGVLKVAAGLRGCAELRREVEVLRRLGSDDRLGDWRALLPRVLAAGEVHGAGLLLTAALPGRDARHLPSSVADELTARAVEAITPLHRLDRRVRAVDAELLERWVDEPLSRLRTVSGYVLDHLAERLGDGLAGRRVALGWTHGDFCPANLLVTDAGQVSGIVDWSQAREQDLAALDLAFWLLTVPLPGRRGEFGGRVVARLRGTCWTPGESRLLDTAGGDPVDGRTVLLLAWLRHVVGNLTKSDRYARSPLWLRRNVHPVLREVWRG